MGITMQLSAETLTALFATAIFLYLRGNGVNFWVTGHLFEVRVYKGFLTCRIWVRVR